MNEYNTIAELRQATTLSDGLTAIVKGYHARDDHGGGIYVYDSTSSVHPNMGTVIAPKSKWDSESDPPLEDGRWLLQHDGVVTVRQFGALGTGDTDLKMLDDLVGSDKPFKDTPEVEFIYIPYNGGPFNGLDVTADTMDWAAIQMSILSSMRRVIDDKDSDSTGLPGVEVPSGVYMCSRPVWIGDDHFSRDVNGKEPRTLGFSLTGQRGNSRQEIDFGAANIRLINNRANTYCLSLTDDDDTDFYLHVKFGSNVGVTVALDKDSTAQDVKDALDDVIDAFSLEVALRVPTGLTLEGGNIIFTITNAMNDLPPPFLGEILARSSTSPTSSFPTYVQCFPDSGILSFRRTASNSFHISGLNLKGNDGPGGDTGPRYASFGILFPTTQFFGHIIERIEMSFADTAVGILQGTGGNGEQLRIDRIHGQRIRRALYTNAPQAFHQEFYGWNFQLQNIEWESDLTGLVFAEFDDALSPGFGANFNNAGATFSDNAHVESDGTLVRARRGTGVVQFVGGRFEHLVRLFNYDAYSDQGINNNMDVVFRGVEFTVVGGGERRMIEGEDFDDVGPSDNTYTQYGLFLDDCAFKPIFDSVVDPQHPEYADIIFETLAGDKARVVMDRCRFLGVRSLQQRQTRIAFRHCYKNDFIQSGHDESPLRQFSDEPPTPGARTQSLRNAWQDTPWIQTGPRFNVLPFSDFAGQTFSAGASTDVALDLLTGGWTLWDATFEHTENDLGGFGKWGAFSEANLSPSPEAFYIALNPGTGLQNLFSVVDLTESGAKVLTYQALLKVTGRLRLSLERPGVTGPPEAVYDVVVIGTGGSDVTDTTLVTLRMQLSAEEATSALALRILNSEGTDSAMQVYWQQAWYGRDGDSTYPLSGGLANAGHVRTPTEDPVPGSYNWAVNALGVKAASRFQLPLLNTATGEDAAGMGWRSIVTPTDYELVEGEQYQDKAQHALMGFAGSGDGWFALSQPDRVSQNPAGSPYTWHAGDAKNIVYTTSGNKSFTLSTVQSEVAPGTVVRVFNFTGNNVTWTVGMAILTINNSKMSEFVFYDDGGTGRWLVTQDNVAAKRWP